MKKMSLTKITAALITLMMLTGLFTGCSSTLLSNKAETDQERSEAGQQENSLNTAESDDYTNAENEDGSFQENISSTADLQEAQKEEAQKEKVKVKALYITGWTAGSENKVKHYIELANTTEINAYVIDIKDDDGYVGYESNVSAVKEINAYQRKYDVDKVLKEFHDNDIHIIGRLVCFKDPVLAVNKPEWAVKNVNGGLWKEKTGEGPVPWVNPANKEAWPYIIDIAKEAVAKGFDEIQFDYVRFPNGDKNVMDFGNLEQEKYEYINEFLSYASRELPGVILSADVFGIICESPQDTENIGQYLELIGKDIDYISPMVYPSHYAVGQTVNGVRYAKPDFEPYSVVYNSLLKAKNRLELAEGYKADIRPYLQDFTASWLGGGYYQEYGSEQVKQQIQAVYDAGFEEWILWDALNTYSESALLKTSD